MLAQFSRRSILKHGAASGWVLLSSLTCSNAAGREASRESHGLSSFGRIGLPGDFAHFGYVNAAAPKGGELKAQVINIIGNQSYETFDTFNIYVLKGNGAAGVELSFDSLMTRNRDEPDAVYGLVARTVTASDDHLVYRFFLREEARFHNGKPITANDVAFSLRALQSMGHPAFKSALADLETVVAEGQQVCKVHLKRGRGRDAHLAISMMPIFQKESFVDSAFDATALRPLVGSGPYRVIQFEQGRFVEYERVRDYWGARLPVNVGRHNFDRVKFEYFRDREVALEAFKLGILNYREENSARSWATQYDIPAVRDGRIRRVEIDSGNAPPRQGWYFNLRREKFADIRIRQAINLCFDFEWVNKNIMNSAYRRLSSYFQNTDMEASGPARVEELAILERHGQTISPVLLDSPWTPPVSDGSGSDRSLLRAANALLGAAGCRLHGDKLTLPNGSPFEIEFLDTASGLRAHTEQFIGNLKRLGIKAAWRGVDPVQYQYRVANFDFDMVSWFSLGSNTPGTDVRYLFGSMNADVPGSGNIGGVADPIVDALVDLVALARDRTELIAVCRALDRVLRANCYWVPMWFASSTRIAYWNALNSPEAKPKFGTGAPESWWHAPAPSPSTVR
ncbi:MAG: ABC transporter substrate-binding protein [Alphaproteobacteria bacterium]|nr:MAG: ABC transporter substrate-binding protein [Alphaproteobacteria bacterium]